MSNAASAIDLQLFRSIGLQRESNNCFATGERCVRDKNSKQVASEKYIAIGQDFKRLSALGESFAAIVA